MGMNKKISSVLLLATLYLFYYGVHGKCPHNNWKDGNVDIAPYSFTKTKSAAEIFGKQVWEVSLKRRAQESPGNSILTVNAGNVVYYTATAFDAEIPNDHHVAVSFEADFSSLELEELKNKKFSEIRRKSVEVARLHGDVSAKVVSLHLARNTDGVLSAFVAYVDSKAEQRLVKDMKLIKTSGKHTYTIGIDGIGTVFACEDDELLVQKSGIIRKSGLMVKQAKVGYVGWGNKGSGGVISLYSMTVFVPRRPNIYVATTGSDSYENNGDDQSKPLKTVRRASQIARAGTTVHIAEGVYRGSLDLLANGKKGSPIVYVGENDYSKVAIVGSISASTLTWNTYSENSNIKWVSLDKKMQEKYEYWSLTSSPRFICATNGQGTCNKLYHVARSPNYNRLDDDPNHAYKQVLFWYVADGGNSAPDCDPRDAHDCDESTWSYTRLTDIDRFPDNNTGSIPLPGAVPYANLKTITDLVGAQITTSDGQTGFYTKSFRIIKHDRRKGLVEFDGKFDSVGNWGDEPGIRSFARYYVWDKLSLLDAPGEYYYDTKEKKLYIWKHEDDDINNLEIGGDDQDYNYIGIGIGKRSYHEFRNLTVSLFYEGLLTSTNQIEDHGSSNIVIDNCHFHASRVGVSIRDVLKADDLIPITRNWEITHNSFSYLKDRFILSNPQKNKGTGGRAENGATATRDIFVAWNNFSYSCWETTTDTQAIYFSYATNITFIHNVVNITGGEGFRLEYSFFNVYDTHPFIPGDAHLDGGDSLVAWNVIDRACEMKADCGAFLTSGRKPFNVLAYENVVSNTFGYTGPTEFKRETSGSGISLVNNHCFGGIFFRNVIFNIQEKGLACVTKDQTDTELVFMNNVIAKTETCIRLVHNEAMTKGGQGLDKYTIKNNLLVDCKSTGVTFLQKSGPFNTTKYALDNNIYYRPGASVIRGSLFRITGKPGGTSVFASLQEYRDSEDFSGTLEMKGTDSNETFESLFPSYKGKLKGYTSIEDRTLTPFDPEWFRPAKGVVKNHRSIFDDMPEELIRLLKVFSICVPVDSEGSLPVGHLSDGCGHCFRGIGKSGKTHIMFPDKDETNPACKAPEEDSVDDVLVGQYQQLQGETVMAGLAGKYSGKNASDPASESSSVVLAAKRTLYVTGAIIAVVLLL